MKGRNNSKGRTGKAPGTFAKGEGGGRKIYSTNSPGYIGTRIVGPRGNLPAWHESLTRSWDRFELKDARKRFRRGVRASDRYGYDGGLVGALDPLTPLGRLAVDNVFAPRPHYPIGSKVAGHLSAAE